MPSTIDKETTPWGSFHSNKFNTHAKTRKVTKDIDGEVISKNRWNYYNQENWSKIYQRTGKYWLQQLPRVYILTWCWLGKVPTKSIIVMNEIKWNPYWFGFRKRSSTEEFTAEKKNSVHTRLKWQWAWLCTSINYRVWIGSRPTSIS